MLNIPFLSNKIQNLFGFNKEVLLNCADELINLVWMLVGISMALHDTVCTKLDIGITLFLRCLQLNNFIIFWDITNVVNHIKDK